MTMTRNDLRDAAKLAAGAVARNGTRPILQTLRLDAQGIRATDLESAMRVRLDLPLDRPVLVNAALFRKALAGLKGRNGPLYITATDTAVTLTFGSVSVAVPTAGPVEEFPVVEDLDLNGGGFLVDREALVKALRRVSDFATPDPTRFQMNSVLFELEDPQGLTLVSTDGKRMAVETLDRSAGVSPGAAAGQYIVPLRGAKLLADALSYGDCRGGVRLDFDTVAQELRVAGEGLSVRLVEGKYPQYKLAIPQAASRFTVKVADLLPLAEAAKAMTTKEVNSCILDIADGKLTVSGSTSAAGEVAGSCTVDGIDAQKIHLNPDYLVRVLKACGEDELVLGIRDRKTAMLFEASTFRAIVMPLVVQEPKTA